MTGSVIFRHVFERRLGLSERTNEIVQTFLEVSGLFYGITLGLIAVGAYDSYKDAEQTIASEAATLNSLYRDVSMLSDEALRQDLRHTVRSYAEYLVDEGWRLQRMGVVPRGTTDIINRLDASLVAYPLNTEKDAIIFDQIMERNNSLGELRRQRVTFVQSGLPSAIWEVIALGDLVIVILTWLLVIKNRRLDMLINILCGSLLGSLIFVIAATDRPFRGDFGVSPEPFQLLLDGVMRTPASASRHGSARSAITTQTSATTSASAPTGTSSTPSPGSAP
ncbi:MAG: DUF4239 domain-containing protein [Polyangiales bacterium]